MKRKHKNQITEQQTTDIMSEILLKYAWSYAIQDVPDRLLRQNFMNVAITAWNMSLLSDDDCQAAINSFIVSMRAGSGGQVDETNMTALENDLHALIKLEKGLYPTNRKMVISAELYDDGDKVGCRTASADFDELVREKLTR